MKLKHSLIASAIFGLAMSIASTEGIQVMMGFFCAVSFLIGIMSDD